MRNWLQAEAYETQAPTRHRHRHDHHHDVSRHDDHIRSFTFADDRAISPAALEMFIGLLQSYHGANMLRMKGIVKVADDPATPRRPARRAACLSSAGAACRLARCAIERTRLVFIVKDIEKRVIEDLFKAFTDQISGDAAAFHTDKTLSLNRMTDAQAVRTEANARPARRRSLGSTTRRSSYDFTDVKEDAVRQGPGRRVVEGARRLGEDDQPRRLYLARPAGVARRDNLTEAKAVALAVQNPSLIRRPLIEYRDGTVSVGFTDKVRTRLG